jgi:hypothetical protein
MNYFVQVRRGVRRSFPFFSMTSVNTSYYSLVRKQKEKKKPQSKAAQNRATKERINSDAAVSRSAIKPCGRSVRGRNYELIPSRACAPKSQARRAQ